MICSLLFMSFCTYFIIVRAKLGFFLLSTKYFPDFITIFSNFYRSGLPLRRRFAA